MTKKLKWIFFIISREGLKGLYLRIFDRFYKKQYKLKFLDDSLVLIRPRSSDISVYCHCSLGNIYDIDLQNPKTIIDLGSFSGITTVYYSIKYPYSKIYSVEPGKTNFEQLCINTENLTNVIKDKLAITNYSGTAELFLTTDFDLGLSLNNTKNINQSETVTAKNINDYIYENNIQQIDLLKINIEGAEKEIFESINLENFKKIKSILADLHDRKVKGCSQSLFSKLSSFNYDLEIRGHFIFISNMQSKDQESYT